MDTRKDCLTFSSEEPFSIYFTGEFEYDGAVEISMDGKNWEPIVTGGRARRYRSEGDPIYLRGESNTYARAVNIGYYAIATDDYYVRCDGNIETLLDYKTVARGEHPKMADACFRDLFHGCPALVSAPELPSLNLTRECYAEMFEGCSELKEGPKLPATALKEMCYYRMFDYCSKLVAPPELPATELAKYCYCEMFAHCSSIEVAPKLPATNLTNKCYAYMFQKCLLLKLPPKLPATNLAPSCYSHMFDGCLSLELAPELPATKLVKGCYGYMFYSCLALENVAEISATYIAPDSGCDTMYNGCTALGNVLDGCLTFTSDEPFELYVSEEIVKKCTLEYSKDGQWGWHQLSDSGYVGEGNAIYLRGTGNSTLKGDYPDTYASITIKGNNVRCYGNIETLLDYKTVLNGEHPPMKEHCFQNLFYKCYALVSAPELPATELSSYCYAGMFRECYSLKEAPLLPATELPEKCYASMFFGCDSLEFKPGSTLSSKNYEEYENCDGKSPEITPDYENKYDKDENFERIVQKLRSISAEQQNIIIKQAIVNQQLDENYNKSELFEIIKNMGEDLTLLSEHQKEVKEMIYSFVNGEKVTDVTKILLDFADSLSPEETRKSAATCEFWSEHRKEYDDDKDRGEDGDDER